LFEPIPVSDKVNRVANVGPELQERVEIGKSTPPGGQLSLL
jgi:hypothetical protein